MTGWQVINRYHGINKVDPDKVRALADSIVTHGWIGCPILTIGDELLTGSHRLAALTLISNEYDNTDVLDQEVAEDVSEIVSEKMTAYEEENGWMPDLDYSSIGQWLSGSWVEEYKDEIEEW